MARPGPEGVRRSVQRRGSSGYPACRSFSRRSSPFVYSSLCCDMREHSPKQGLPSGGMELDPETFKVANSSAVPSQNSI